MADNADDVADDYRQALEDLTMNSRIEIATLTNIARENASHGLAITEVLTNHIKKVPPARTLPALYVLDSVVKNVPTPYALYFGPKLYSIFMGAYTKVDNGTRRKMDEMLKTWKEPVPGSISTKSVFPPEHVRPIEHALVAFRQAAYAANQNSFQGQQQLLRGNRAPIPPRDTPTPPNVRPLSQPAGPHSQQQPFPGPNGHPPQHMDPAMTQQQPYPMRPHHDPSLIQHRAPPQAPPLAVPMPTAMDQLSRHAPAGVSIDKLRDDIQQLIIVEKKEFVRNPLDTSKQTRLKALLDLQTIIQRPDMPQDQLMLVKERVTELAVNMRAAPPAPAAAYAVSTPTPPVAVSQYQAPVPPVAVARPPSVTPGVGAAASAGGGGGGGGGGLTLDALLGQGALAALLSGAPKPATPVGNGFTPSATPQLQQGGLPRPGPAMAAIRSPPPQVPAVQPPPAAPSGGSFSLAGNPSALLAMLRQSGLITPTGASTGTPAPASRTPVTGHASLPGVAPAPFKAYTPPQFTMANLRHNRPHLTAQLHESLGPPCTQCGRRFRTDEDGRRKKTAHMDWHFRVHQRIAEYEKRGSYRSPFVDEIDWIETPITVDIDYVAPSNNTTGEDGGDSAATTTSSTRKTAQQQLQKLQYIPVPDDSSRVNSICPICQERFEMKWLDEAQEWVWMDAVKIGDRVFHASCHREAAGDRREATPGYGRGTPEPVLGKRKAEDDFQSARGKLKMEGYGY